MTTNDTAVLTINNLKMAYGDQTVINNLSLTLQRGEIGCLLGASGCGKTSVLRTIAGFERPVAGAININGHPVSTDKMVLPPAKRAIAMVFQDYALFPHLTVWGNVAFGLRKGEQGRVEEMLAMVGLESCAASYPHQLSGGQQQRVALARALARQPCLLLMDEPFSNLDIALRERLSVEVRAILKKAGTTTLFVTHNQQEAFALADVVGVMEDGVICQWDAPYTLYHEPVSVYVADFIGEGRLISGRITADGTVATALGVFPLPARSRALAPGQQVSMLIRPEDILHVDSSPLRAHILQRTFRGAGIMYELQLDGGEICQALVSSSCDYNPGEWIGIQPDVGHVVLFPFAGER